MFRHRTARAALLLCAQLWVAGCQLWLPRTAPIPARADEASRPADVRLVLRGARDTVDARAARIDGDSVVGWTASRNRVAVPRASVTAVLERRVSWPVTAAIAGAVGLAVGLGVHCARVRTCSSGGPM